MSKMAQYATLCRRRWHHLLTQPTVPFGWPTSAACLQQPRHTAPPHTTTRMSMTKPHGLLDQVHSICAPGFPRRFAPVGAFMAGGTLYSVALGDVRGEGADAALSNVLSLYQRGLTASAPLCWTFGASWDLVRAGVPSESPLRAKGARKSAVCKRPAF